MTAASAGERTIDDRNTGEKLTFLETADECGGARVVMRLELAPGTVIRPHAHPIEETFELLQGELEVQLDGRRIHLQPGAIVTAPGGRVHGPRNLGRRPAVLRIVATPGHEAEYGLRVKFLVSRDGYLSKGDLLLAAVIADRAGLYFPPLPRWLFRPLFSALAAIGRWRGREKFLLERYPEYARFLEARAKRRDRHADSAGD